MGLRRTVQIARDPFARETTIRQCVPPAERRDCASCGQPARFVYGTWPDAGGGPRIDGKHQFCGVSCWRSYHA